MTIQNKRVDANELIEISKQKAQGFFDLHLPVHIKLKTGQWRNGVITEIFPAHLILSEFEKGSLPLFFIEIEYLERYTPPKKTRIEQGTVRNQSPAYRSQNKREVKK